MYNFVRVRPDYTGGGVYLFIGKFDGNQYFLASDMMFDVRIIDTNPFDVEEYVELWDADWQTLHLKEDLDGKDRLLFFKEMIEWVQDNEPEGNYQMDDLDNRLQQITKLELMEGE